jgi:hypothetical protein
MERLVDLDAAAREIESRRAEWERAGFTVGPLTWRDDAEPWPQSLRMDRASILDPDSVGVSLDYNDSPAALIVMFRGGWADVDIVDFETERGVALDGTNLASPQAFGDLLDQAVDRIRHSMHGRD